MIEILIVVVAASILWLVAKPIMAQERIIRAYLKERDDV